MNFQPQFLVLLVILVFAGLFLLAIRTSRRQSAAKDHQATILGYEEVTSRPDQLISRVESTYRNRSNQSIQLNQVYTKRDWDQEFFIFDIEDTDGDSTDLGSEVFGLISSQLALPHFTLTTIPGFTGSTMIGGLMKGLMDKALTAVEKYQGLQRIELPDIPDLAGQAIIFGKDPEAVQRMLKKIDLRSIVNLQVPVHISGVDDFLAIDFSQMGSYQDPQRDLIAQHEKFTRILRNFTK